LRDWAATLPIPIDTEQFDQAREAVVDFVTTAEFGAGAVSGVATVVEVITGVFLGVVILYFLLKDGERIWGFLLRPLDADRRARGERIGRTSVRVLGGYARGTAIIALVDAVVIGIALAVLQVPLALPLAAVVFLGAFIPI